MYGNNFRTAEWVCTKFRAIIHDNFLVKLLQLSRVTFKRFVRKRISDRIKYMSLVIYWWQKPVDNSMDLTYFENVIFKKNPQFSLRSRQYLNHRFPWPLRHSTV